MKITMPCTHVMDPILHIKPNMPTETGSQKLLSDYKECVTTPGNSSCWCISLCQTVHTSEHTSHISLWPDQKLIVWHSNNTSTKPHLQSHKRSLGYKLFNNLSFISENCGMNHMHTEEGQQRRKYKGIVTYHKSFTGLVKEGYNHWRIGLYI